MTEKQLIEEAKRRDPKAISILYENNIKYIYRFVYYKTNHKEIAEDLTAEAFTRAFEHIDQFRGSSSFKTWICSIARNLVIEWYRNKDKTTQLKYEPEDHSTEDVDNTKAECKLKKILDSIKNERYKTVLELRYLMGYNLKETAEELNVTVTNVKVIQNRAIKKAKSIAYQLEENEQI